MPHDLWVGGDDAAISVNGEEKAVGHRRRCGIQADEDVDAVVTLGAVIKGDTRHDDIVAENAARLIADLSLEYGKPVALGITGPGMTLDQAKERAELVPRRCINAAVNMVTRLGKLQKAVKGAGTVVIDDTADDN